MSMLHLQLDTASTVSDLDLKREESLRLALQLLLTNHADRIGKRHVAQHPYDGLLAKPRSRSNVTFN